MVKRRTTDKLNFDKVLKYYLMIPTFLAVTGFVVSGLMIIPKEWDKHKQYQAKVDQLVKKVYGASPDDMDGIRASVEREIEMDHLIEDGIKMMPLTKEFFSVGLPRLKSRIKENENYIKRIRE
jgi:hypothetical protein